MIRRDLEQRKTLSDIAKGLGFAQFVRADEETRTQKIKETLEDVYEAFIGAMVTVIDTKTTVGMGYRYAYLFVKHSLDAMTIDVSASSLVDSITRINELYKSSTLANSAQPLKWGDQVKFEFVHAYISVYDQLPAQANPGDIAVTNTNPMVQVFVPGNRQHPAGWMPSNKLPKTITINFPPPPAQVALGEPLPPGIRHYWYAGVYGFLDQRGNPIPNYSIAVGHKPRPNKDAPTPFLDPIDNRHAALIGQGFAFKQVDAKKNAADKGLRFLESKGYAAAKQ
jgi:hypothetical protein